MKQDKPLNYKDYKAKIKSRNDKLIKNLGAVATTKQIQFENYKLDIDPSVFNPEWGEGSEILSRIKHFFIGDVLEIGTGSGILSILAAEIANKVIATDINPAAISCAEKNILNCVEDKGKIELKKGDLFDVFKDEKEKPKFDTIIFNPPFLNIPNIPADEYTKKTYLDKDYSVLETFLEDAKNFLNKDGCIYICFGGVGDVGYLNYLVAFYKYEVQILQLSNIKGLCYFVYELSKG